MGHHMSAEDLQQRRIRQALLQEASRVTDRPAVLKPVHQLPVHTASVGQVRTAAPHHIVVQERALAVLDACVAVGAVVPCCKVNFRAAGAELLHLLDLGCAHASVVRAPVQDRGALETILALEALEEGSVESIVVVEVAAQQGLVSRGRLFHQEVEPRAFRVGLRRGGVGASTGQRERRRLSCAGLLPVRLLHSGGAASAGSGPVAFPELLQPATAAVAFAAPLLAALALPWSLARLAAAVPCQGAERTVDRLAEADHGGGHVGGGKSLETSSKSNQKR